MHSPDIPCLQVNQLDKAGGEAVSSLVLAALLFHLALLLTAADALLGS